MKLGDNTLHPLEIADAREAAYRASELQQEVENRLKDTARDLADCERRYRQALSQRILALHAGDGETKGLAISTCETVARGEPNVAALRFERDIQTGIHEAAKQEAFRRGADRRTLDTLLNWSMRRDLAAGVAPPFEPTGDRGIG